MIDSAQLQNFRNWLTQVPLKKAEGHIKWIIAVPSNSTIVILSTSNFNALDQCGCVRLLWLGTWLQQYVVRFGTWYKQDIVFICHSLHNVHIYIHIPIIKKINLNMEHINLPYFRLLRSGSLRYFNLRNLNRCDIISLVAFHQFLVFLESLFASIDSSDDIPVEM